VTLLAQLFSPNLSRASRQCILSAIREFQCDQNATEEIAYLVFLKKRFSSVLKSILAYEEENPAFLV
jgi:hypothetical protein